jgi:hypothetical protein
LWFDASQGKKVHENSSQQIELGIVSVIPDIVENIKRMSWQKVSFI